MNFELKGFSLQKLIQILSSLLLDTKEAILNQVVPVHHLQCFFFSLFVQIIKCVDYLQKHKDKSNFLKAAASATQNTPNIKRFIFQTKILRQSAPTQAGFMINANKHSY